jgi:hypothetical protein
MPGLATAPLGSLHALLCVVCACVRSSVCLTKIIPRSVGICHLQCGGRSFVRPRCSSRLIAQVYQWATPASASDDGRTPCQQRECRPFRPTSTHGWSVARRRWRWTWRPRPAWKRTRLPAAGRCGRCEA